MDAKKSLEYYEKLPYHIILEPWDDGQGVYWVARVAELPHCLIHGDTPEEAIKEIEGVKRDWVKSNLERGLKIPEPISRKYSGQISLRIPPSLHKLLSDIAAVQEVSLNQFMTMALAREAGFHLETGKAKAKRGMIYARDKAFTEDDSESRRMPRKHVNR
ncbi:MAG: type II toxin-antitoxin system HicB family antitoxin [Dehalococcoidia bacterium]|nr:type II toxin-antitoxin system HicB family antitoxin [Dehalococcoidia bacterium]